MDDLDNILARPADVDDAFDVVTRAHLEQWALERAGLNPPSARAFAAWLDSCINDWEGETIASVLHGAWSDWTGADHPEPPKK